MNNVSADSLSPFTWSQILVPNPVSLLVFGCRIEALLRAAMSAFHPMLGFIWKLFPKLDGKAVGIFDVETS